MPEIVQPDPTEPGFTGDATEGLCHGIGPHRTSVCMGEHEGLQSYVHPNARALPSWASLRTLSNWQELGSKAACRLDLCVLGLDWTKVPSSRWCSTLVILRIAASRSTSCHMSPKTSDLFSPVQIRVCNTGYHRLCLQESRIMKGKLN